MCAVEQFDMTQSRLCLSLPLQLCLSSHHTCGSAPHLVRLSLSAFAVSFHPRLSARTINYNECKHARADAQARARILCKYKHLNVICDKHSKMAKHTGHGHLAIAQALNVCVRQMIDWSLTQPHDIVKIASMTSIFDKT